MTYFRSDDCNLCKDEKQSTFIIEKREMVNQKVFFKKAMPSHLFRNNENMPISNKLTCLHGVLF